MKVHELIEKLQKLDQNAIVECYQGYDFELGPRWLEVFEAGQEATGWSEDKQEQIFTAFIR